jgi:hypothetical protein
MKLRNVITSWTILIPSLVLNVALLAAMVFFLNQLEFFYQQELKCGPLLHARIPRASEKASRLAVHEANPAGEPISQGASPR